MILANFTLLRYMRLQQQHKDADAKAVTRGQCTAEQLERVRNKGQPLPIDPDYYEGAVEFYSKEIQRNRSLRLMMKRTTAWYSSTGTQFTEEGDHRKSILSPDPFASRALRQIISWNLGIRDS